MLNPVVGGVASIVLFFGLCTKIATAFLLQFKLDSYPRHTALRYTEPDEMEAIIATVRPDDIFWKEADRVKRNDNEVPLYTERIEDHYSLASKLVRFIISVEHVPQLVLSDFFLTNIHIQQAACYPRAVPARPRSSDKRHRAPRIALHRAREHVARLRPRGPRGSRRRRAGRIPAEVRNPRRLPRQRRRRESGPAALLLRSRGLYVSALRIASERYIVSLVSESWLRRI